MQHSITPMQSIVTERSEYGDYSLNPTHIQLLYPYHC